MLSHQHDGINPNCPNDAETPRRIADARDDLTVLLRLRRADRRAAPDDERGGQLLEAEQRAARSIRAMAAPSGTPEVAAVEDGGVLFVALPRGQALTVGGELAEVLAIPAEAIVKLG